MQSEINIFIELDAILKSIDDENYQSYSQLFLELLNDINRIKRKTIFILRDVANKEVIKKYFHEDFFDYFELINMENLDKVKIFIEERNLDVKNSLAILTCEDAIQAFRQQGVFTAYLKIGQEGLHPKKAIEIVDYQKAIFTNLFDVNWQNLVYECNKFNNASEDEENEDDI